MGVWRGGIKTEPENLANITIGPDEIHLYESRHHQGNFLDCVRSRKQPSADVETGHRSTSLCHLINMTRDLGRKLAWDPKRERFANDDQANSLLARPRRKGFEFPRIT